jgi:hypothetical protein
MGWKEKGCWGGEVGNGRILRDGRMGEAVGQEGRRGSVRWKFGESRNWSMWGLRWDLCEMAETFPVTFFTRNVVGDGGRS